MANNSKDFSILLTKVTTKNNKKDISVVNGLNKIVQLMQQACNVNKGELMADYYFGTDVYQYIFSGVFDKQSMQAAIAYSIQYAVPNLSNVSVELVETTDTHLIFDITFTVTDFVNTQTNARCTIEVSLT